MTTLFASDLQILEAVLATSKGQPVELEALFDAVDSAERWVPGYGQLNWSLSRLLDRGLVSVSSHDGVTGIEPTPAARQLSYEERSAAAPRRPNEDARLPEDRRVVSSAEYLASHESYVRGVSAAAGLSDRTVRRHLASAHRSVDQAG